MGFLAAGSCCGTANARKMRTVDIRHEILIRATPGDEYGICSLEVRCSCGHFLLDREGSPAEVSLVELTQLTMAHYAQVRHPEQSNGHTKLIKGKK